MDSEEAILSKIVLPLDTHKRMDAELYFKDNKLLLKSCCIVVKKAGLRIQEIIKPRLVTESS